MRSDGRGRDEKWLINLYQNRPHAGIFPLALILCDIWAKKNTKPMPYMQSPAGADFKTHEELTQIIFCSFIFIFMWFSFSISSFWHILFLPSVCPGKNLACGARTVPIHLNGKKRRTFVGCDLKWALQRLETWESMYNQIYITKYILLNTISVRPARISLLL